MGRKREGNGNDAQENQVAEDVVVPFCDLLNCGKKKAKDKVRNDDRMKVCGEMVWCESERAIRLARDCPSCLYILIGPF